ncbi:substrate-binding periplasmic protein [Lacibacterium aquatile]|uniref:Substrate-binding periplasmic protein n=1 Tax=Lacibacterium aquatile TaxID=1168082 RepID=A0ABW5DR21_9PROT
MLRALLILPFLLAAVPARAVELIAHEVPPYVFDQDGIAYGPAIDIARELVSAVGIHQDFRILPSLRFIRDLEDGGRIGIMKARTRDTEDRFQWIAPLATEAAGFAALAPRPAPETLTEAQTMGIIGVMEGGFAEPWLDHRQVAFDATRDEATNLQKLLAKRIDVWLAPLSAMGVLTGRGGKPSLRSQINVGPPVFQVEYYIVASRDVPAAIVEGMQRRHRALIAEGTFQALMHPTR